MHHLRADRQREHQGEQRTPTTHQLDRTRDRGDVQLGALRPRLGYIATAALTT